MNTGRNETCPHCNSGKKFKKCCLVKIQEQEQKMLRQRKEHFAPVDDKRRAKAAVVSGVASALIQGALGAMSETPVKTQEQLLNEMMDDDYERTMDNE